jgi:hypothetical protein
LKIKISYRSFICNLFRYLGDEEEDGVDHKNQAKTILEGINEQARLRKKLRASGESEEAILKSSKVETREVTSEKLKKKSDKTSKKYEETVYSTTLSQSKKRKLDDKTEEAGVVAKKKLKTKKEKESKERLKVESEDTEIKTKKHKRAKNVTDSNTSLDAIKSSNCKKKKKIVETSEIAKETVTLNGSLDGENVVKKKHKKVVSKDSEQPDSSENEEDAKKGVSGDEAEDCDAESDAEANGDVGNEAADETVDDEVHYGSHEFGGYTVLGEVKETQTNKVRICLVEGNTHFKVLPLVC